MRAFLVIVLAPNLHLLPGVCRLRNQRAFRHSARKRPLKASLYALSVGLPGREKSRSRRADRAHRSKIARHELGALVDPDRRREARPSADPFQHLQDIGAAESESRHDRGRDAARTYRRSSAPVG